MKAIFTTQDGAKMERIVVGSGDNHMPDHVTIPFSWTHGLSAKDIAHLPQRLTHRTYELQSIENPNQTVGGYQLAHYLELPPNF